MNIKTQNTEENKIEVQFSDAFTVRDHSSIQLIVEGLMELRKRYEIK